MPRLNTELRSKERIIEQARLRFVKEACWVDPKAFIAEIDAFDPTTLTHFHFTMYPQDADPYWCWKIPRGDEGWLFQAAVVDWWMGIENPLQEQLTKWSPNFVFDPSHRIFLNLKARQLGITWLAMALELWHLLFRPGSRCVAYSYNEDEAKKLIGRAWLMYQKLPVELKSHVEVLVPQRSDEPAEWIKVKHKDSGLISSVQALPATKKAGHGDTVTFALMDEAARMDHCRHIFTAILPAVARGDARLALVSTANGVGNSENGEGNYFHILYETMRDRNIGFAFLPWSADPTRDEQWYDHYARKLDEVERNQQYPLNEADAFMLSGSLYFDRDSLEYYRGNILRPIMRGQFVANGIREDHWINLRDGIIDVWEQPVPNRRYAVGVDCATGRGLDYTVASVIDLETGAIVAELHAKIDSVRAGQQIHALGRWFNHARIAVETQGGYGEAMITFLRDGSRGLPPYPNLYRHVTYTKGSKPLSESYGLPMNQQTRPQVVNGLADWIRNRSFPWLSVGTVNELGTFAHANTNPSPRALPGCNDDRVMALGIAVEMFRQYGRPPARVRRKARSTYKPSPIREALT